MKILFYSLVTFLLSALGVQAEFDLSFSIGEVEAVTPILETYALTSFIIIACVTSIVVFRSARKMRGGVFGSVLTYFGLGMVSVLAGYLVTTYPNVISIEDSELIPYLLFIFGYVLMAVAATKLSSAIEGK